jgi:hypothetical protein
LCNDKKSSLNRDKPDTVNERARNPTLVANNQHAAYIMIHFFHLRDQYPTTPHVTISNKTSSSYQHCAVTSSILSSSFTSVPT